MPQALDPNPHCLHCGEPLSKKRAQEHDYHEGECSNPTQNHTPTPWFYEHNRENDPRNESLAIHPAHFYFSGVVKETDIANANRIVSCVNACEGINPEAVPELLSSCDTLLQLVQDLIAEGNEELFEEEINEAKQALAKARE